MVITTQEMRRRWSDKTSATFSPSDRIGKTEFPAESFEREFDFKSCKSIVFFNASRQRSGADFILSADGTGHVTLPAGVDVIVDSGYVKWEPAYGSSGAGSTIGVGIRAPPSSRVGGSQVGSTYSGMSRASGGSGSGYEMRRGQTMPTPPSSRDTFVSARDVPLPASVVSGRGGRDDGWFVEEEMGQDDTCSIAPSESISSVGSRHSRGARSGFY